MKKINACIKKLSMTSACVCERIFILFNSKGAIACPHECNQKMEWDGFPLQMQIVNKNIASNTHWQTDDDNDEAK